MRPTAPSRTRTPHEPSMGRVDRVARGRGKYKVWVIMSLKPRLELKFPIQGDRDTVAIQKLDAVV